MANCYDDLLREPHLHSEGIETLRRTADGSHFYVQYSACITAATSPIPTKVLKRKHK